MSRLLAFCAIVCGLGCSGDPLPLRDCTPGATLPCACVGGGAGAQTCTADAHLGACVCPDAGGAGDALAPDAHPSQDVLDDAPDVQQLDAVDAQVPDAVDAPDAQQVDALDADALDAPDASSDAASDAPADVACDTASDPANCGACGRACVAPANAIATCIEGLCRYACLAGFGDCDGRVANGCELPLTTDAANCGACGHVCGSAHGMSSCRSGTCVLSCDAPYSNCDGNTDNGCETNLRNDRSRCGSCSRSCSGGSAYCADGACVSSCESAGQRTCHGVCVSTRSDPANCGACDNACGPGVVCWEGACGCASRGLTMCGAGCVDINTNANSCGACGNDCTAPNSIPECRSGRCYPRCQPGWCNNDGNAANGCETRC